MADDLDLDGLEREALKATQDPVSTAFLTKTNADVDEWMTSVYTAGKDADFRLHCLWAWQEQARRSASTILDLIHRLRAAETAVSQGQADLLAVSAALAEARDNDRAAMGWLVDARAAAGDDGKRMLPEFVEYLKGLKADAERYVTIREDILGVGAEDGVGQELERLLIRVMNERGVDAIPTNAEFDSAVDRASKNNSV